MSLFDDIHSLAVSFESLAADFKKLVDATLPTIKGLLVKFDPPTTHGEKVMPHIKLLKKSHVKGAVKKLTKGAPPPVDFILQDNGDATFTVLGADGAGNPVDISGVATLSALSSDTPTTITVDPPVGMTSAVHAVGPIGSANILATATWNDGSIGPFSITQPVTTVQSPTGGLTITFGTPTIH